jgi:hypothetical protein
MFMWIILFVFIFLICLVNSYLDYEYFQIKIMPEEDQKKITNSIDRPSEFKKTQTIYETSHDQIRGIANNNQTGGIANMGGIANNNTVLPLPTSTENIEKVIKILNDNVSQSNNSAMFLNLCSKNLNSYKFSSYPISTNVYFITIDQKKCVIFNPFETTSSEIIRKLYCYAPNPLAKIKKFTFKQLAIAKTSSAQTVSDYHTGEVAVEYEKAFDQNDQLEVEKIMLKVMNETIQNKTPEVDFNQDMFANVNRYLMTNGLNSKLENKPQYYNQPDIKRLQIDSLLEIVYFYPITNDFNNIQHYYHINQLNWPITIKEITSISINSLMEFKRGRIECKDPTSPLIREIKDHAKFDPKNAALMIAKSMFKNEWRDEDTKYWNDHHHDLFKISVFNQHYLRFDTEKKIYLSPMPETTKNKITPKLFEPTNISNSFDIADVVELAIINNTETFLTIGALVDKCESKGKYQYSI